MKFQKLCGVLACAILVIVMMGSAALADNDVTISTVVPEANTVEISVASGGKVTVDGTENRTGDSDITRPRGSSITFTIVPDEGYEVDGVFYNGEDITDKIKNGEFDLERLVSDGLLEVTFRKVSPASQEGGTDSPKTADTTDTALWSYIMLISAVGVLLIGAGTIRNRRIST